MVFACGSSQSSEAQRNSEEQLERLDPGSLESLSREDLLLDACVEQAGFDLDDLLGGILSNAEVLLLMEKLLECAPDLDQIQTYVASFTGTINLLLDGQASISSSEGSCAIRYILDNSDNPARTLSIGNTEEDGEVMVDAFRSCFTQENFAVLSGESGAQNYGENLRLDLMFDECEQGDMRVCDLMYASSAVDSEYFDLAYDCAGQIPATESSCSLEGSFDLDTGFALPNSPGLEVLSEDCTIGDLTACDLLYIIAPIGSEYEAMGFTCAGRIPIGAVPDCRTSLGSS